MLTPKEVLDRLRPATYRYNNNKNLGDKVHYGFIAQDLQELGPEYAFVDDGEDYLKVNYHEFIAVLVKVVQEQDKRITDLEQKLKDKE